MRVSCGSGSIPRRSCRRPLTPALSHAFTGKSGSRGPQSRRHGITSLCSSHQSSLPLPCHRVSAPQLSLLEASMARMERVAVWSLMSGGGANIDVFTASAGGRGCSQ